MILAMEGFIGVGLFGLLLVVVGLAFGAKAVLGGAASQPATTPQLDTSALDELRRQVANIAEMVTPKITGDLVPEQEPDMPVEESPEPEDDHGKVTVDRFMRYATHPENSAYLHRALVQYWKTKGDREAMLMATSLLWRDELGEDAEGYGLSIDLHRELPPAPAKTEEVAS